MLFAKGFTISSTLFFIKLNVDNILTPKTEKYL